MATANATVKAVLEHLNSNGGGISQEWHDDAGNWYRKYADGWIEQGGHDVTRTGGGMPTSTISFHTPFKDTNYTFVTTLDIKDSSMYTDATLVIRSRTASSLVVGSYDQYNGGTLSCDWIAFGY